MQITIELHNHSDLQLLLAFLNRIGAEVIIDRPQPAQISAVNCLEVLAKQGGIKAIADPSEWQREGRQDRPLVFREL